MRAVSSFRSGSHVSIFGQAQKVEAAAVSSFRPTRKWKLRTHFSFGPEQVVNRKLFKPRSFKSWLRVYHSLLASIRGLCQ